MEFDESFIPKIPDPQSEEITPEKQQDDWYLLISWFLLTVSGFYLGDWIGEAAGAIIFGTVGVEYELAILSGLCQGIFVGLFQWWYLQKHFYSAPWWILASMLGFVAMALFDVSARPLAEDSVLLEIGSSVVQGSLLGLAGWLYLRKCFDDAFVWIGVLALTGFVHFELNLLGLALLDAQWPTTMVSIVIIASATSVTMWVYLKRLPAETPKPKRRFRSLHSSLKRAQKNESFLSRIFSRSTEGRSAAARDSETKPQSRQAPTSQRPEPPKRSAPPQRSASPPQPGLANARPPEKAKRSPAKKPSAAPVSQAARAVSATPDGLPAKLELVRKKVRLASTQEPATSVAMIDFNLPRRPRRARLRVVYSGMNDATRAMFCQHVQINSTILAELPPREQDLEQAVEYSVRIPEESFARSNKLIFVSRSSGADQSGNSFLLHSAVIEFDW